jgi:TolA-binding protein
VRVQRGWVTVTRSGKVEEVRAGQASGCEPRENAPEESTAALTLEQAVGAEEAVDVVPAAPNSSSKSTTRTGAGEPALSSLAQQNSLLARALAAERNGKHAEAESQLSRLLSRFPSTPLRADAEAARARIRKRQAELGR